MRLSEPLPADSAMTASLAVCCASEPIMMLLCYGGGEPVTHWQCAGVKDVLRMEVKSGWLHKAWRASARQAVDLWAGPWLRGRRVLRNRAPWTDNRLEYGLPTIHQRSSRSTHPLPRSSGFQHPCARRSFTHSVAATVLYSFQVATQTGPPFPKPLVSCLTLRRGVRK